MAVQVMQIESPKELEGMCSTKTLRYHLQLIQCNDQACIGDEISIAQQDLIIMPDVSGFLKATGFEALRTLAVSLTKTYQPTYFATGAVRIGVAPSGNGHLLTMPDGTTSLETAIQVQSLTSASGKASPRLAEQDWQRGFTNIAQALAMAETVLSQGAREGPLRAVLMLWGGKYSFEYQPVERACELTDRSAQVFMALVAAFEGKDLKKLKQWSSHPCELNDEVRQRQTMPSQCGREGPQSAVLVLSGGRYSSEHRAMEEARELPDRNVQVSMALVADFEGKEAKGLKQWASQPWEMDGELVPGLAALENNDELFDQKSVAKFCPDSFSSFAQKQKDFLRRYMLIHGNGWPGVDCGKLFFGGKVGWEMPSSFGAIAHCLGGRQAPLGALKAKFELLYGLAQLPHGAVAACVQLAEDAKCRQEE